MDSVLLSISVSIFVFMFAFSLFKKSLKLVAIISLVIGGIVFFSYDAFSFELFGSSVEGDITSKSLKSSKSVYIMIQNKNEDVFIFENKKPLLMKVSEDNHVILFDKKARKFDIGIVSEPTIKKMIHDFYGKLKLYNVKETESED